MTHRRPLGGHRKLPIEKFPIIQTIVQIEILVDPCLMEINYQGYVVKPDIMLTTLNTVSFEVQRMVLIPLKTALP